MDIKYSTAQEVVNGVYLKGGAQLRRYEDYRNREISAIYGNISKSKDKDEHPVWKEMMWCWRGNESQMIYEWNNP